MFSVGLTLAVFNERGTTPSVKTSVNEVIRGEVVVGRHALIKLVGTGLS